MTRFDPSGPLRGCAAPALGQVDLPPRGADRGDGGGGDDDRGLPRRRRHPLDAGRGRRRSAREVRGKAGWAEAVAGARASAADQRGRPARRRAGRDRRRQRGDAAAAAAGMAGGAGGGRVDARRRRVDPSPAGRPDRGAAARDGRRSEAREDRLPPLEVRGAPLHGITYEMPIASAQVKSCLLFAGLLAEGETRVVEPLPSRDHTERMLAAAGASVEREGDAVVVRPPSASNRADRSSPPTSPPPPSSSSPPLLVAGSEVGARARSASTRPGPAC